MVATERFGQVTGWIEASGQFHFAQFDVRTGKLLSGPVAADVPTYTVHVDGGTVYVIPQRGGP